ncbi:MAG: C4-dicarboxylate transporter permease [Dehalococcoidia bacterium]|nr:C4-dicarboxylate transporter permease [Dehalococcoidia bacterium]
MDPIIVASLIVALLLFLIFIGMPIAFALGISGVIGIAVLRSMGVALDVLGTYPWGRVLSFLLTLIPMFILMGQLADVGGISKDAYAVGYKWLGHIPGGLGMATVAAATIFGAASGASTAAAAALGKVCVPEMRKYGYDSKLAAGCVASAALLDILIPPSLGMVIYGVMAEESIGKLLVAGIIPGILTALNFAILLYFIAKVRPEMAPLGPRTGWKERFLSLRGLMWVLVLFILVMGGIYSGAVTPTEAGAIGAFGTLVIALINIRREGAGWRRLKEAFIETTNTTAMVFALLIGASIFSLFLAMLNLPGLLAQGLAGLPPVAVLVLVVLAYIPLGMFLDPMSMLVLTIPVLHPLMTSLGYDGIWFGIIVMKLIEISLLTPPVGLNVYVIKGVVPDLRLEDIFKGVAPFLVVEFITLIILIIFPQIILWLPGTMK